MVAGSDGVFGAGGHGDWRDGWWPSGRKVRTARQLAVDGGAVSGVIGRLRLCVELAGAAGVSVYWRAGDWRVFGAGANVHRGNCASEMARAAGGTVSVQYRVRNFAGVFFELCGGNVSAGRRGMEMEAGCAGNSGVVFSCDAVWDSA